MRQSIIDKNKSKPSFIKKIISSLKTFDNGSSKVAPEPANSVAK